MDKKYIEDSKARAKAKWLASYCNRQKDCPGCTFYIPEDAAEYDGIVCQLTRNPPDGWGIKAISTERSNYGLQRLHGGRSGRV
jgi:hypothetical protein